jgi:hypothetical protein
MYFNNGDDLSAVDEINDICVKDNNSYPLPSKARRINGALNRFYTIAFKGAKKWSFDDFNRSNAPVESINLSANTKRYALDTFTSEIINILRVEILTSNGTGKLLTRLDRSKIGDALSNYKTTAGTPDEYDLLGKFIDLYSKPSYSSANGLTLYIDRNKVAFNGTETATLLPVPSLFEMYICRVAALPELVEAEKSRKNDIAALIAADEAEIPLYFRNREKELSKGQGMRPAVENTR